MNKATIIPFPEKSLIHAGGKKQPGVCAKKETEQYAVLFTRDGEGRVTFRLLGAGDEDKPQVADELVAAATKMIMEGAK